MFDALIVDLPLALERTRESSAIEGVKGNSESSFWPDSLVY
jgi:hypothetical protein